MSHRRCDTHTYINMYIYRRDMPTYVHVYKSIHTDICEHLHINVMSHRWWDTYTYIYVYTHVWVYIYICIHTCMSVHIHICGIRHIYMYTHMYMCTYVHDVYVGCIMMYMWDSTYVGSHIYIIMYYDVYVGSHIYMMYMWDVLWFICGIAHRMWDTTSDIHHNTCDIPG